MNFLFVSFCSRYFPTIAAMVAGFSHLLKSASGMSRRFCGVSMVEGTMTKASTWLCMLSALMIFAN